MRYEFTEDPWFDAMPKPQNWVYRDMKSKIPEAEFESLLKIVGHGNFKILAATRYKKSGLIRGQFLLSPEGLANIEAHNRQEEVTQ